MLHTNANFLRILASIIFASNTRYFHMLYHSTTVWNAHSLGLWIWKFLQKEKNLPLQITRNDTTAIQMRTFTYLSFIYRYNIKTNLLNSSGSFHVEQIKIEFIALCVLSFLLLSSISTIALAPNNVFHHHIESQKSSTIFNEFYDRDTPDWSPLD